MTERGLPAAGDFTRPLARAARERGAHPALLWDGGGQSYAELEHESRALAARLAGAGLRRGDRLAIVMENEPLHAALLHAALGLGVSLVPLHPRLTAAELAPLLADAQPQLVVCAGALEERVRGAAGASRAPVLSAAALLQGPSEPSALRDELDPEADQAILFTSGTTGRPKGVRLSVANQWASARASAQRLGVRDHDRWLLCMPLYHVGGLAILLRAALGATTVLLHERFDPAHVRGALAAHGVTQVSLVSTMLARLLDAGSAAAQAGALRCVLLGGGPLAAPLLQRARGAGFPIAVSYGLTEAASQVATSAPGDDPELGLPPLPATELRSVAEDGSAAAPGAAGEILVRGPQVMRGYLDRPDDSARALRGGWLHTGDFGRLDAQGRLRVLERRSDLIVSGGENVYPSEIESVLLEHPGVREAAVVARRDGEWGQRVEAVLVCEPSADPDALRTELLAHCALRLARFKHPRAIHFTGALPRTASGKLRRDVLRESLERETELRREA